MFEGVYTALITPFRNGAIDYDVLESIVAMQIAKGIDGIVPMGTTGESPTVSFDEHKEFIRRVVKLAVPQAQETISYRMPAFKLKRIFFYFAAFKKHVGVYPPVTGDERLKKELLPFSNDKGNLKFPLNAPIPYELIARVAAALSVQYSGDVHDV